MTIKLLSSGYYHVRWNANQWFQWPRWRPPTMEDGFGWVTEKHRREAQAAAEALEAPDGT